MTFQSGKQKYRIIKEDNLYDWYSIQKQEKIQKKRWFKEPIELDEWKYFCALRLKDLVPEGDIFLTDSSIARKNNRIRSLYKKGMLRQLLPEIKEYVRTVERKRNMNLEFTLDDEAEEKYD